MQHRVFLSVLAALLITGATGCSSPGQGGEKGENAEVVQRVSLAQVPEPARAVIAKLTAGGKIRKIEKTEEGGRTIYDVEATVKDRQVEYDVAADGSLLTAGQSVSYASVPRPVRSAAEKYFGSAAGLKAFEEVEKGQTFYEISGRKGRTPMTLKLSDTGQIVEEEKE